MKVLQCKLCKKPFQTAGRKFCPSCMSQIDQDFFKVRDYIYEHKHAGAEEISEATEVPISIIAHLIDEGRLKFRDDSPLAKGIGKKCRVCGKAVQGDSICTDCKNEIASKMQQSVEKNKPDTGVAQQDNKKKSKAKMHTGSLDK